MVKIQTPSNRLSSTDNKFWSWFISIIAVYLFCFGKIFHALISAWVNNSAYSHGFIIPFISFYMIWKQKEDLKMIQPDPEILKGLTVLSCGLIFYTIGFFGGVFFLEELAIVTSITGLVILIMGREILGKVLFPILLLSFMLTSWGMIFDGLHGPFQTLTAAISAFILKIAGVPVHRSSIFIELPGMTLEVAKECSGVNYLVAVACIGIPLTYTTIKSWRKRSVLVACALFLSILANGLRVALIGILSYNNITTKLHGPYHLLHGIIISTAGYAVIFLGIWIFADKNLTVISKKKPCQKSKHVLKLPLILAAGLLFLTGIYINFHHIPGISSKKDLKNFPVTIGRWNMSEEKPNFQIPEKIGADVRLERTYKNSSWEIKIAIGYFGNQFQGKKIVNAHTDELHNFSKKIQIHTQDETIEVNRVNVPGRDSTKIILFWYDINGKIFADRYAAKAYNAWCGLVKGTTNGAVILISTGGKGIQETMLLEKATDFSRDLIPLIRENVL